MQKCRRSRQHPGEEIEKTGGPKHADRRHQSHQRRQDSSHRFKPRKRPFDKIIKNRAFLKHRKPNDIKQNNRNQVFREVIDAAHLTAPVSILVLYVWFESAFYDNGSVSRAPYFNKGIIGDKFVFCVKFFPYMTPNCVFYFQPSFFIDLYCFLLHITRHTATPASVLTQVARNAGPATASGCADPYWLR